MQHWRACYTQIERKVTECRKKQNVNFCCYSAFFSLCFGLLPQKSYSLKTCTLNMHMYMQWETVKKKALTVLQHSQVWIREIFVRPFVFGPANFRPRLIASRTAKSQSIVTFIDRKNGNTWKGKRAQVNSIKYWPRVTLYQHIYMHMRTGGKISLPPPGNFRHAMFVETLPVDLFTLCMWLKSYGRVEKRGGRARRNQVKIVVPVLFLLLTYWGKRGKGCIIDRFPESCIEVQQQLHKANFFVPWMALPLSILTRYFFVTRKKTSVYYESLASLLK